MLTMQIDVVGRDLIEIGAEALIISVFEGERVLSDAAQAVDAVSGGQISNLMKNNSEELGKFGTTTVLHATQIIIIIGMGKREKLNANQVRKLAAIALRAATKQKAESVAVDMSLSGVCISSELFSEAWAEGAIMGTYRFTYYKTESPANSLIKNLYFVVKLPGSLTSVRSGADRGKVIAEAVNFARDMVNHPANYLTPTKMAEFAQKIADKYELELSVFAKYQIENMKMEAFAAVAQGSDEPPRLIVLKYNGSPDDDRLLAFVGKGVTFDSGGLSLKPAQGMNEMKDDMAGGAAVLGAIQAIAALRLPVNIIGVIPCTENMPSGHAFRPGDVIGSMAGKTIEIITTDAEGRLILADAITYALKAGATHLVDIATLTGACLVALGDITSGVMGNDAAWTRSVLEAAEAVGERMWELPLFEEYREQLKSPIADLKNSGGRKAGAILGGLFLGEFAQEIPWVHIDIGGTVSNDKESGYNIKGPSGVGVRTLVELAKAVVCV
ncbi:MAG: pepA [Firmicutes bacterium]|nr:pepA [Bacillota bacterium]